MGSSTPQTTTRRGPSWISEPLSVEGIGLPEKGRVLGRKRDLEESVAS